MKHIIWFRELGIEDVNLVGGKNASLGEMIKYLGPKGVKIPDGFAITADAYRYFIKDLKPFIKKTLIGLDTHKVADLAKRGKLIREAIKKAVLPEDLKETIITAYRQMERQYGRNVDVAVRSSATAEDVPEASFAGQHETFLNIRGEKELLEAVRACFASLFTDRAISYRVDKHFDHFQVALSVGVQKMVRADLGASGVMFTLDTESGFPKVVLINGVWGLGEMIVQGKVTPDEFLVFKPMLKTSDVQNIDAKNFGTSDVSKLTPIIDKKLGKKNLKMIYGQAWKPGIKNTKVAVVPLIQRNSFVLTDAEVLKLAQWGVLIEEHYSKKNKHWSPMDLEWAKDGRTNELFIIQARPETVHSRRDFSKITEYQLINPNSQILNSKIITRGAAVGSKIAVGKARVILDVKNIKQFKKGEILVTDMTDPDWEPIMKIAAAVITDKGGRTSHAAIVSRELGIPCVVGTENATRKIKTGQLITVDTTASEGLVYDGLLKFKIQEFSIKELPKSKVKVMLNIATPETAFEKSFLPNDGVGLAREEFIIAGEIGIHPMALVEYKKLKNFKLKTLIDQKTAGYSDKKQFFIDKLAFGIAKIAAAFWPKPVIVRFSDFKTNEYRSLLGGEEYEPLEENPMLGWRGASRYYHPKFAPAFALECAAIKKVREEMGLINVAVMVPFCRTPEEGRKVLEEMAKNGLRTSIKVGRKQNESTLKIFVMCEIPSNILRADEFLDIFDGMSIGSNDLTQLTVGIDRDASELVRSIANEKDISVKKLIAEIIKICRQRKKYIGICGQAPSDFPEFARWLVQQGIESISLNPDSVVKTILELVKK